MYHTKDTVTLFPLILTQIPGLVRNSSHLKPLLMTFFRDLKVVFLTASQFYIFGNEKQKKCKNNIISIMTGVNVCW